MFSKIHKFMRDVEAELQSGGEDSSALPELPVFNPGELSEAAQQQLEAGEATLESLFEQESEGDGEDVALDPELEAQFENLTSGLAAAAEPEQRAQSEQPYVEQEIGELTEDAERQLQEWHGAGKLIRISDCFHYAKASGMSIPERNAMIQRSHELQHEQGIGEQS